MDQTLKKPWIWGLLGMMVLSQFVYAQPADQVMLKDDTSVRGVIQEMSIKDISLQKPDGSTATISLSNVKRVIYGDTTQTLGEARQSLSENRFSVAVQQARRALQQIKNGEIRKLHRPRVKYFIGRALFMQGNYQEAIDVLQEELDEHPDNPKFYPLSRTLVLSRVYQSHQQSEEERNDAYKTITTNISELIQQVKGQEGPEQLKLKMKLLGAEAREEYGGGKIRTAMTQYKNLVDSDNPEIHRLATSGHLRCMVRIGENLQEAIRQYESLLEDEFQGDAMIKSGYLNAQGVQHRKRWESNQNSTEPLRKALFSFLKASVLTPSPPSDPTIQQRQSLLNTAHTYGLLAEQAAAQGTSYYRNQARKTYQELIEIYSGTPEAIKAKSKLNDFDSESGKEAPAGKN